MAAYTLIYEYLKKPYQIVFHYEKYHFELYVKYEDWLSGIVGCGYVDFHIRLKNKLDKADIKKAIQVLKQEIDADTLEFYKSTKTEK